MEWMPGMRRGHWSSAAPVRFDQLRTAVDYRIPGGLQFEEIEYFVNNFLQKVNIIGMSVTIYNASLDKTGSIAAKITDSLGRMFQAKPYMK
jgi:arginase